MRVDTHGSVILSDRNGGVSLYDDSCDTTMKIHTQRERVDITEDDVLQRVMLDPLEKSSLDGGPAGHGLVRIDVGVVATPGELVPQH